MAVVMPLSRQLEPGVFIVLASLAPMTWNTALELGLHGEKGAVLENHG